MNVYRASALGGCDKALVAARLGYTPMDPPEQFAYYFARGEQVEVEVINWLHENDYKVRDQQLEVVIDCPMGAAIVGHLDGIVTSPQGGEFVGEIKRMTTVAYDEFCLKTWDTPGLIQKYKWQLSAYMVATGLPGLVVVREGFTEKDLAEAHAKGKWLVARTRVVEVPKPFYDRTELVRRVVELELLARKGLPETCSNPSYPCSWFYLHSEENNGLLPASTDGGRIQALVSAYRSAQAGERVSKELLDTARRELVAAMEGSKKVVTDTGVTVTKFMKKNPPRWDEQAMVADGVDVGKYRSQSSSEQVRVTGD